jgi:hypothetical protein
MNRLLLVDYVLDVIHIIVVTYIYCLKAALIKWLSELAEEIYHIWSL